jgi:hypothetical protein
MQLTAKPWEGAESRQSPSGAKEHSTHSQALSEPFAEAMRIKFPIWNWAMQPTHFLLDLTPPPAIT